MRDYGKRYAFLALDAVLDRLLVDESYPAGDGMEVLVGPNDVAKARVLGASRKQVARWRDYGVTFDQADACAIRLGLHPAVIWPEWRADGLTVLDDEFVNGGGWRTAWEWDEQRRSA